jgi:hypothetical protein
MELILVFVLSLGLVWAGTRLAQYDLVRYDSGWRLATVTLGLSLVTMGAGLVGLFHCGSILWNLL